MRRTCIILFFISFSICMVYALITDHRWEDWYITYRASKNLAIGNGLTFTPGERVHSFTSPINTLLPAFFAAVFKSNPDEYAIWLYRIVNSLVIGFCSVLLFKISDSLKLIPFSRFVLISLFLTNILIIDNSINGMETPYMMVFLLLLIYNLTQQEESKVWLFVASFTGLMYTRPDGFVYASFLLFGYSLFHLSFKKEIYLPFFKKIAFAACISILFYAPWLVGTWLYYGTPIPHTIMAKSNLKVYEPFTLLKDFLYFPVQVFLGKSAAQHFFMPGYASLGGWYKIDWIGKMVSSYAALLFLLPFIPKMARSISLSLFLGIFYLDYISGQGGMPWYLPNLSIQVVIIIAIMTHSIASVLPLKIVRIPALFFIAYCLLIFLFGAYQMKTQQQVIEFGNRKKIGEWLKSNSQSEKSTVFMECLGYIGYFSQLKTYDFPGMSSLEVVKEVKELKKVGKANYSNLIDKLNPDWLVLRPIEAKYIQEQIPELLPTKYHLAKVFDVRENIPQHWYLLGKNYLYFDAVFYVYKKK